MGSIKDALHGMVVERIPQFMQEVTVGDLYVFSFGSSPVEMKVVDADLIKPDLVQYTIEYKCRSSKTREVRFSGKVFHREKVKSGD